MSKDQMLEEIYQIRSAVQVKAPLIHCITNPISIHDCANVVLAVGESRYPSIIIFNS